MRRRHTAPQPGGARNVSGPRSDVLGEQNWTYQIVEKETVLDGLE